jgi:hypothetical protein
VKRFWHVKKEVGAEGAIVTDEGGSTLRGEGATSTVVDERRDAGKRE